LRVRLVRHRAAGSGWRLQVAGIAKRLCTPAFGLWQSARGRLPQPSRHSQKR
jgi:hypothetical protein